MFDSFYANSFLDNLHFFFTQIRVLVLYLKLFFLATNQDMMHYFVFSKSFFEPSVLRCFVFLSSLMLISFWAFILSRKKKEPLLGMFAFGIFWYFSTISLEASFIPNHLFAIECRNYLPSVGLFIAISSALFRLYTLLLFSLSDASRCY